MLYLIFAIIPSFFLYEPRELIQFLEYFIHSSETQWHTVRTDDSVFPLLLLVEDSIFHSHPGRVGESELTHPATRRNLMVRATLVAASTVQFEWIFGRDSRHRLERFTEWCCNF